MKKNKKLNVKKVLILVSFFLLAIFVGGGIIVMLIGLSERPFPQYLYILSFIAFVLGLADTILLGFLFADRKKLMLEIASSKEYFDSDEFVYGELFFKDEYKRRHFNKKKGIVVALGVKDLNGEVISGLAVDDVKDINETIFRSIHETFSERKNALFAYSPVKGFILYVQTEDEKALFDEVNAVSSSIMKKLQNNPALPVLTLLLGAYIITEGGEDISSAIDKAYCAEKFDLSTRLDSGDIVVYSKEMVGQGGTQRDLAYELAEALDEDQLEVYYQPKFDIQLKRFYGAEALIRWNHPARGLLPPSLFIPFAEQNGRIVDIDRYVFRHVCADIAKWEKEKRRLLRISFNLSRRTIYDPSILTFINETMAQYKVNPLLIDIELTESVASKDTIFTAAMIKKIKTLHMEASIDDFGTGFSSFAALKRIPFDTIKVDKSFIDDIEVDKKARDMVECIINLGHAMGMKVIAEGVQSEKEVEILKKLNLNAIQGYFYSKPLPEYEYVHFLETNKFEKGKGDKK